MKQIAELTENTCDDNLPKVLSIKSYGVILLLNLIQRTTVFHIFSFNYHVKVYEYKKINENVPFPKLFSGLSLAQCGKI